MQVKLLLLPKGVVRGLVSIREHASEMIDISDWADEALSDATSSGNQATVIKDNILYTITRTYFDLDNNCRVILAEYDVHCKEDVYPPVEE